MFRNLHQHDGCSEKYSASMHVGSSSHNNRRVCEKTKAEKLEKAQDLP